MNKKFRVDPDIQQLFNLVLAHLLISINITTITIIIIPSETTQPFKTVCFKYCSIKLDSQNQIAGSWPAS